MLKVKLKEHKGLNKVVDTESLFIPNNNNAQVEIVVAGNTLFPGST